MNLQGNVGQVVSGAISGKLIKSIGKQTQMAVDQNKLDEANKRVSSQLSTWSAHKKAVVANILNNTMNTEPVDLSIPKTVLNLDGPNATKLPSWNESHEQVAIHPTILETYLKYTRGGKK